MAKLQFAFCGHFCTLVIYYIHFIGIEVKTGTNSILYIIQHVLMKFYNKDEVCKHQCVNIVLKLMRIKLIH